jgi:HKD family nuclease
MVSVLSGTTLRVRWAELVEQSESIDIAVAWATSWSGLGLLLSVGKTRGKDRLRIIVGVYDYLTSPKALKEMAESADLRIYGSPSGQLFHPKLYIFKIGERHICWGGSANLTRGGLPQ